MLSLSKGLFVFLCLVSIRAATSNKAIKIQAYDPSLSPPIDTVIYIGEDVPDPTTETAPTAYPGLLADLKAFKDVRFQHKPIEKIRIEIF